MPQLPLQFHRLFCGDVPIMKIQVACHASLTLTRPVLRCRKRRDIVPSQNANILALASQGDTPQWIRLVSIYLIASRRGLTARSAGAFPLPFSVAPLPLNALRVAVRAIYTYPSHQL